MSASRQHQAGPGTGAEMIDISQFAGLVSRDHGLAVIALALPDGTVHASVASAGVLSHPLTGVPVVGVVAAGWRLRLAAAGHRLAGATRRPGAGQRRQRAAAARA